MDSAAYDRMANVEERMWWYRARRSIVLGLLRRFLPPSSERRVLDVGCGTGYNLKILAPWGRVEGVDPAPEALAYCRQKGFDQVKSSEGIHLPYPPGHFGLVTALDVIEHIEDDARALREWYRVLQPGGTLLIFTPALPWLYGEHDRIVQHFRRYRKSELKERLEGAGFEIQHLSYAILAVLPIVLLVRAVLDRLSNRPHAEMSVPPFPVNQALQLLCASERPFVLGAGLPLGMSLAAVARRPAERLEVGPEKVSA